MPDRTEKGDVLEVTCPCCEARITVDPASGAVLGSEKAAHARAGVDLRATRAGPRTGDGAHPRTVRPDRADRKGRDGVLEKLFRVHIEKSKDEPATRPLRDIDLD